MPQANLKSLSARQTQASLGDQMISGAKWTAAARWGSLLITWPTTILLARLLSPAAFGYIALVGAFTGFGALLAEGGLTSLIVVGEELEEVQYRRLHGWSLALHTLITLTLFGAAAPIEAAYDIHGLAWVVVVLASTLMANGMALVPAARLRRIMRFRDLAVVNGVSAVAQAAVSLLTALAGAGYWALIYGYVVGRLVGSALTLRFFWMLPMWPRVAGLQRTLANSGKLLLATLTTFGARGSDAWIGAAIVGAGPLGGYTYMKGLAGAPMEKISGIVHYVSGPALGNVGDDPVRLGRLIVRLTRLTALLLLPVFAGLALVARDLTMSLLGPQWVPYIPALQIYCVYAAVLPLIMSLQQGAVAADASGDVARTGMMFFLILPPAFFLLAHVFGATGLALAWVFPLPLVIERLLYALKRQIGLTRREVLGALAGPAIAVAVMAGVVMVTGWVVQPGDMMPVLRLLLRSSIGAATYVALTIVYQREDVNWIVQRATPKLAARLRRLRGRVAPVRR